MLNQPITACMQPWLCKEHPAAYLYAPVRSSSEMLVIVTVPEELALLPSSCCLPLALQHLSKQQTLSLDSERPELI